MLLHRELSYPSCHTDHLWNLKTSVFCYHFSLFISRFSGSGWRWLSKCWSVACVFLLVFSTTLSKIIFQSFSVFHLKTMLIIFQTQFCGLQCFNYHSVFRVLTETKMKDFNHLKFICSFSMKAILTNGANWHCC